MLNLNRAALLILSAVFATGASAMGPSGTSADFGAAVANTSANRTVALKPGTRHVNVVNGETVTFTVDGKEFSWHVNTWPNVNQFDLEKIAPQDIPANGVKVYVSPNPLYFGA